MVTRTETKTVTGKINGLDVTVPAGTTILEAARMAGIEVPNLCYQPLLRAWGSCRICTVNILGKRGGLIESCATPLGDGMEVETHTDEVVDARQYILQMYLIDHALDCPTCDASGQCYLQDNTYLHNLNANPYRRPKLAQPYIHFSDLVDYKWDRCIMCNRCTRVCDEMIGVTAIESAYRSLEATITPAYGQDLSDTTCTHCGMCISVCPVGALTDRHFAHHPWELDATETICGHCDVGCTLNVESNKGIVRRVTNLWERGVNHGYLCKAGTWGHESIQDMDRLFYPMVKQDNGMTYEVTWDDAVDAIAETLAHHQGDRFAALVGPDSTNEEAYVLQQFARAVMATNNVDRLLSPDQIAVERGVRESFGRDVSNTNTMQEMLTDVKSALVVGPDLGKTAPVASYWFYHARQYREAKTIVISRDDYPLCWRSEHWLKPAPNTTAVLLNGMARQIVELGLVSPSLLPDDLAVVSRSLASYDLASVAAVTEIDDWKIREAAALWASGGAGPSGGKDGLFPPALIYQTLAHQSRDDVAGEYGDPAEIARACTLLSMLTGNLGKPGGGVASLRGPANYQGTTDMGAHPEMLPGGVPTSDLLTRSVMEEAWMSRWAGGVKTSNGFLPVRSLPETPGIGVGDLVEAIESGRVTAMVVDASIDSWRSDINPALFAALEKLEFLVVLDGYRSKLAGIADIVLPKAQSLEKDGTYTNFDRTVQRLRAAVPGIGESRGVVEAVSAVATRMGYAMEYAHPAHVMLEIAQVVPDYAGVTYARLERGGLSVPVESFASPGTPVLSVELLTSGTNRSSLLPDSLMESANRV